jgi:hypothetical protein
MSLKCDYIGRFFGQVSLDYFSLFKVLYAYLLSIDICISFFIAEGIELADLFRFEGLYCTFLRVWERSQWEISIVASKIALYTLSRFAC